MKQFRISLHNQLIFNNRDQLSKAPKTSDMEQLFVKKVSFDNAICFLIPSTQTQKKLNDKKIFNFVT